MHDARSSRHEWFDTKSKLNLLRWLVCSAVVLNLNVQVAHLYKNIRLILLLLVLSLIAELNEPALILDSNLALYSVVALSFAHCG